METLTEPQKKIASLLIDWVRGHRMLDHAADGFVKLLAEVHRYPLAALRQRVAAPA